MPVGAEIYNDSGTVQLSTDLESYVLHSKGTVNSVAPSTPYQVSSSPVVWAGELCTSVFRASTALQATFPGKGLFAFSCTSNIAPLNAGSISSNDTSGASFVLACSGAVGTSMTWYYFAPMSQMPASGSTSGIQIFSSTGQILYDSAYKPLRFVDRFLRTDNTGTSWAQGNIGPVTLPAGRQYALMAMNGVTYKTGVSRSSGNWRDYVAQGTLGSINSNVMTAAPIPGQISGVNAYLRSADIWDYTQWGTLVVDVTGF